MQDTEAQPLPSLTKPSLKYATNFLEKSFSLYYNLALLNFWPASHPKESEISRCKRQIRLQKSFTIPQLINQHLYANSGRSILFCFSLNFLCRSSMMRIPYFTYLKTLAAMSLGKKAFFFFIIKGVLLNTAKD